MFARSASDPLPRAPRLLLLVFGIFLVLVGIAGSALVAVTSSHLTGLALQTVLDRDRSLVDLFANANLTEQDLDGRLAAPRRVAIQEALEALGRSDDILAMEIRGADGRLVAEGLDRGRAAPAPSLLDAALAGTAGAEVGDAATMLVYLPLQRQSGEVLGAIVLERDIADVLSSIGEAGRDVLLVTLVSAAVLAGVLVLVFRAAHHRIRRQQADLVEASRRDALTGLLNHGSAVALLSEQLGGGEQPTPLAVALVDVDNFRLFNDTHGHEAGDAVLVRVAELVADAAAPGGLAGRYGPDEFMIAHPGVTSEELGILAGALSERLRELTVRVGDSEELPVSVSVGIAATPTHAASVTPLLAEATVALGEAQAGGGDRVVIARLSEERGLMTGGFDVLQGLVLAVDTKDRYTKRHSEDVARYGVYLATRLGYEELLEPIRLAGLLHDVGKIGVPDRLLRKPGRLSEAEVKAFNQHVVLGSAIVQGLPEMELVRTGILHHHERWDGGGYVDGLAGEAIPLIARIIAVADTFSAMTTTRPYRKALAVDEALRRLREAAGTQLQPELVEAFAAGIESDPLAPMPNEASDVWLPLRVA